MTKKIKKKKLKETKIYLGLFDYTINIVIGDYKYLPKYVADKFEDKLSIWEERLNKQTPRGQYHIKVGYAPIIWLPRKPQTPTEYGTLAHEATHIMVEVCDWAGIKINFETEEILAHGVGTIVRTVMEK